MKRRYLTLAGAVGIGLLLWLISRPEPRFNGQKLSAWIAQCDDGPPNSQAQAQEAIRSMGEPAISRLIRWLGQRESRVSKFLRRDFSKDSFTARDRQRAQAASALGTLGPSAARAVPALEKAAQEHHWAIAARAQASLIRLGRATSPRPGMAPTNATELGPWLKSVCTLAALGSNTVPQIDALLTNVQASLPLAFDLVQLLCTNHLDVVVSRPLLVQCLKHEEWGVRGNAINAVIINKNWGPAEIDGLTQCLTDPNVGVRQNALVTFGYFAPPEWLQSKPPALVAALTQAVRDPDPNVRTWAAGLLKRMTSQKPPAPQ